jgi:hypothetical protein
MLGALAAVALVVGSIGVTMSVTENEQQATEQAHEAVVEVQAVEGVGAGAE